MSKVPEHPVIPSMIGMLHDVDVSTAKPVDKNLLEWDDTAKKWVPGEPSSTIFRSADGSCWKIIVKDDGTMTTVKIPCPGNTPPTFGTLLADVPGTNATIPSGGGSYTTGYATVTGRLLFVCVNTYIGSGTGVTPFPTVTVTDDQGMTWHPLVTEQVGTSSPVYMQWVIYWGLCTHTGTTNVTVSYSNVCHAAGPIFDMEGQSSSPIGVSGAAGLALDPVTDGTVETLNVPCSASPAPTSTMITLLGKGNDTAAAVPAAAEVDSRYTSVQIIHANTSNYFCAVTELASNSGGATDAQWTPVAHPPTGGAGTPFVAPGVIWEVRAP